MDDNKRKTLLDHVAGATVRHSSPFADLDVPAIRATPPPEVIERWIKPFYLVRPDEAAWTEALRPLLDELDEDMVRDLLTYFNWRPRIVAAYFATVRNYSSLEEHLGRLLLRSDVCYAGRGYALALTSFNTPGSLAYMTQYLDYYLDQPDLWFDQGEVVAGVTHLDRRNGTKLIDAYRERWARFTSNKPNWDLGRTIERFDRDLNLLTAFGVSVDAP